MLTFLRLSCIPSIVNFFEWSLDGSIMTLDNIAEKKKKKGFNWQIDVGFVMKVKKWSLLCYYTVKRVDICLVSFVCSGQCLKYAWYDESVEIQGKAMKR